MPFWIGLLIVLVMQGVLGLFGYEVMHLFQKWMSIVLGIMFVVITVKLVNIGNWHAPATAHGGALVGGFILMTTISASFVISWGAYASDYSRYMKPDTSRQKIFWLSLAGVSLSSIWVEILGLAAASLASTTPRGAFSTSLVAVCSGTCARRHLDRHGIGERDERLLRFSRRSRRLARESSGPMSPSS